MERQDHSRADDRPRDINQLGKRIVDLATRERNDAETKPAKPKPRRERKGA